MIFFTNFADLTAFLPHCIVTYQPFSKHAVYLLLTVIFMEKPLNTTKLKILKQAGKLFSQKGYFGTSMDDIATRVGIKKPAIYYHFESKEVIFETLLNLAITELKNNLNNTVKEAQTGQEIINNLLHNFVEFKTHNPEISILTMYNPGIQNTEAPFTYIKAMQKTLVKLVTQFISETNLFSDTNEFKKLSYDKINTIGLMITTFVFSPLPASKKDIATFSQSILSVQDTN